MARVVVLTDTQIYMLRSLCGFSGKCRNKDGSLTPTNTWEKKSFEKLASLGYAVYNSENDSYSATQAGKEKYEASDSYYSSKYP